MVPIIVFVYNRPDHFQTMLQYLQSARGAAETELYVYCDGAKSDKDRIAAEQVREIADKIVGFKKVTVHKQHKNLGLKNSVISGVSEVLKEHESVIVLEDDICVSPAFLEYMGKALSLYKEYSSIWSVSGFVVPSLGKHARRLTGKDVFLVQRASSWGWGTWRDRWFNADWDEQSLAKRLFTKKNAVYEYYKTSGDKIRMLFNQLEMRSDSWAILWDLNHFLNGAYCLYPAESMVINIGLDNSGIHSVPVKMYVVDELVGIVPDLDRLVTPDPKVAHMYSELNRKWYRNIFDFFRGCMLYLKYGRK